MKHEPGEPFHIEFSDEEGRERTSEELDELTNRITEIANEYGFDKSRWGTGVSNMVYCLGLNSLDTDLTPEEKKWADHLYERARDIYRGKRKI